MKLVSLKNDLYARYFISYSRRDASFVERLKHGLRSASSHIWHDIDQIYVGDKWRNEIQIGIQKADELILIVSNASVKSEAVLYEIKLATEQDKAIRPILISDVAYNDMPKELNSIQHLDLRKSTQDPALELTSFLRCDYENTLDLKPLELLNVIKKNGCRGVWPSFSEALLSDAGREAVIQTVNIYDALRERHEPQCLFYLNSGLLHCILSDWNRGLSLLKSHAEASSSFHGWYMYALHLNRGDYLGSLAPNTEKEVRRAIYNAESFGANPLFCLLKLMHMLGANTCHASQKAQALKDFSALVNSVPELNTEYLRLLWCFRNSLNLLREHKELIVNTLRRITEEK